MFKIQRYDWAISAFFTCSIIFGATAFLELSWWTNDDVAMSMMAHGYGAFDEASPKIIFSNIVWGAVVHYMPSISGYLGYSVATLLLLGFCIFSILFALRRFDISWLFAIVIVTCVFARPLIFPQFTLTAGMSMLAALVLVFAYSKDKKPSYLIAAVGLAFCASLIRDKEAWLVLLVAIPVLPWRSLLRDKFIYYASTFFILLVLISNWANVKAYDDEDWKSFKEFQAVRTKLIDYGGLRMLRERPDIYEAHEYTLNDLNLLSIWFFADREIANPKRLESMLDKLESTKIKDGGLTRIQLGFSAMLRDIVVLFTFCSLLMFMWRGNWRVALSWGVFGAFIFYFAMIGRPGILRVYLPVMSLLFIAPLFFKAPLDRRSHTKFSLIAIICVMYVYGIVNESLERERLSLEHRESLHFFPRETIAVTPGDYWSHYLYPLRVDADLLNRFRFESFGWSYLSPASVGSIEAEKGNSFIDRFVSEKGVYFRHGRFTLLLERYCEENFTKNSTFRYLVDEDKPETTRSKVFRGKCYLYD